MGLRKTPAALVAFGTAAALAIAGCSSSSSSSAGGSSSTSSAPAQLTVWRMGGSVPSQVTWMNNVVTQFHKNFPQYAHTKVNVVWVPWTSRTTDWNNALASGKNAPDITELGNTDTPTEASLGVLTNVSSYVNSWSNKAGLVGGMLANDTQNGDIYAVPWFGGVRGVWYRTDQFAKAGITSPPTTWAQLVTDAQKLQQTFPGTYGIDAITDDTNAFASFVWGAGGQIATQSNGTWTANLTSPADEAAIKFYVSLYRTYHLSPSKYIGQTELGNTDTPTEASLSVLTNVSSYVDSWSAKPGLVPGMLANDTQNGDVYAVPWFGGVRGVWYRTDQFTKAGISSPPTTWAQLVTDAQKLTRRRAARTRTSAWASLTCTSTGRGRRPPCRRTPRTSTTGPRSRFRARTAPTRRRSSRAARTWPSSRPASTRRPTGT